MLEKETVKGSVALPKLRREVVRDSRRSITGQREPLSIIGAGRFSMRQRALWAVAPTAGLLLACGSGGSVSPTETTPYTTRAFVHVLDQGRGVLSTFMVDPRTGGLSLVDTKAVPNVVSWSSPLAADPRGRFVYVNADAGPDVGDGSFRSYRVDGSSGTLTLASEAPMTGLHVQHVTRLAATAGRLYFGDEYAWGGIYGGVHGANGLGVFSVDENGVLAEGSRLIRDWDDTGGFTGLFESYAEPDVVLVGYEWNYQLRALTLDATVAGGYREIARLDCHDSGPGPVGPISSVAAADGRVFFNDDLGRLYSYALNLEGGTFDERGRVPDAGRPQALGAPDRLAVLAPNRWVLYDAALHHYQQTTSIALYRVGPDGGLSPLSRLPESYFVSSPTLVFHPSGRFLYACGLPTDGSPWGSVLSKTSYVLTFSLGPDGGLTLFGSLPVAGCGPMVVTAPAS